MSDTRLTDDTVTLTTAQRDAALALLTRWDALDVAPMLLDPLTDTRPVDEFGRRQRADRARRHTRLAAIPGSRTGQ
jgi:hypothetical protein